jgi:NADH:ubiquinone oxidoreductase subunit 5 (subunit L)/multisubunit Na+/H+ antiporter MnhA subunit
LVHFLSVVFHLLLVFGKDEILADSWLYFPVIGWIAWITARLIAFYMFCIYFITFKGNFRANSFKESRFGVGNYSLEVLLLTHLDTISMLQENLWEDSLSPVYLLHVRKLCIDNPCQAVLPLLIAFSITEFWNSTLQNAEKNLSLLSLF